MSEPTVSILMPMRNARRYVAEAVGSVLNQGGVNVELVVIDDGSTDCSADEVCKVADGRVRIIAGPCKGVAAAFNAGLNEARGEFLGRCDADDRFEPGRLRSQAAWLQARHEFGAVCGAFSVISRRGATVRQLDCGTEPEDITEELRSGSIRTHLCTWLVRREHVARLHGCREFFSSAEDIDLQLRLSEVCRVWFEPSPCYGYRVHDESITHRLTRGRRMYFEEMAREFQRQRRSGPDDLERGVAPSLPPDHSREIDDSRLHIQGMLLGRAWDEHLAGKRGRALTTGLKACLTRPSNLEAWRSFGALAIRGK